MKEFLKKLLPNNIFLILIAGRDNLQYFRLKLVQSNKLFAFISMCSDMNYLNEHITFLKGAYIYENSVKNNKENIYFLRRNIHRLEKGLLMKPLRKEYGLRFILSTVENYINISDDTNIDIITWGRSILNEYFRITESHDNRYLKAKNLYFTHIKEFKNMPKNELIPYLHSNKSNITFESLKLLVLSRKSVRWFKPKEVDQKLITQALDIARFGPSSCNRQPYRYIITVDANKAKNLAAISGGTVGWSDNVQAIAILVGKQRSFTNTLNRHSIYIDSTLTVMPFLLALETLELSSCIINWTDIPSKLKEMKKILSLEEDESIIMSIAIGYSSEDGKVACSERMPVERLVKYI